MQNHVNVKSEDGKEILGLAQSADSQLGFFVNHNTRPSQFARADKGSSLQSFNYLKKAKQRLDAAYWAMLREATPEAYSQLSNLSGSLFSDFARIAYWPYPHFVRPDDRDLEAKGPKIDEKNYTKLSSIGLIEQTGFVRESLGWGYKSHDSNRQRRPYQLTLLGTAAAMVLFSENSD